MKRKILFVLLSFMMIIFVASPTQKTYAATTADNSVIILSGSVNDNNELVISTNLTLNTGISGMTLELVYDKNVMTLTNVVFGTALSSLEPITTNTSTEQGFAITPFKFNYLGQENDFSTGNLFTLTFKFNDSVRDGNYMVSLKYTKNKDVNYIDSNGLLKTKNLYIDNAKIEIQNNSIIEILSIRDSEEKSKTWIVILCVSLALVAGGVVVAIVLLKRKRNWKRL